MTEYHVLLVEDDPFAQDVTSIILRHHALHVEVVPTGEAALDKVTQRDYDALVIDLMLPGVSGWELLGQLRSQPTTAAIPCVAITAFHEPELSRRALAAGFAGYLAKPLNPQTLIEMLELLLE